VAGSAFLPWGFELSMNMSYISRLPQNVQVPSLTLPGTAPTGSNEPLPGIPFNSAGVTTTKSDLAAAIDKFNSTYAGTKDAKNNTISPLLLPTDYQLGDPTISQDFSLQKTFTIKERYKFLIIGQVFNAFNISNLTGYSFALDTKNPNPALQTFVFGQPTARAAQTFGSAGSRAFQVGARFTF